MVFCGIAAPCTSAITSYVFFLLDLYVLCLGKFWSDFIYFFLYIFYCLLFMVHDTSNHQDVGCFILLFSYIFMWYSAPVVALCCMWLVHRSLLYCYKENGNCSVLMLVENSIWYKPHLFFQTETDFWVYWQQFQFCLLLSLSEISL